MKKVTKIRFASNFVGDKARARGPGLFVISGDQMTFRIQARNGWAAMAEAYKEFRESSWGCTVHYDRFFISEIQ